MLVRSTDQLDHRNNKGEKRRKGEILYPVSKAFNQKDLFACRSLHSQYHAEGRDASKLSKEGDRVQSASEKQHGSIQLLNAQNRKNTLEVGCVDHRVRETRDRIFQKPVSTGGDAKTLQIEV